MLQLDLIYFYAEKNCWPSSDHFNWIHRHNWHMGAPRGRPASVRGAWSLSFERIVALIFYFINITMTLLFNFCHRLETTRHVSMITITLSKNELNTSAVGWVSTCFSLPSIICCKVAGVVSLLCGNIF